MLCVHVCCMGVGNKLQHWLGQVPFGLGNQALQAWESREQSRHWSPQSLLFHPAWKGSSPTPEGLCGALIVPPALAWSPQPLLAQLSPALELQGWHRPDPAGGRTCCAPENGSSFVLQLHAMYHPLGVMLLGNLPFHKGK